MLATIHILLLPAWRRRALGSCNLQREYSTFIQRKVQVDKEHVLGQFRLELHSPTHHVDRHKSRLPRTLPDVYVIVATSHQDKVGRTPNFSRVICVPKSRSQSQTSEENHSPTSESADHDPAPLTRPEDAKGRRGRAPPPIFKNPWVPLEHRGVADEIDAVLHSFPVPPSPRVESGSYILGSFDSKLAQSVPGRQQSAQGMSEHGGSATWSPIYSARTSTSSNHEDSFRRRQSSERLNFSRPSLRSSTLSHTVSSPPRQARMCEGYPARDATQAQPRSSC